MVTFYKKIFALAGNPNCGKTTLFNLLTGGNCHVGNWSGVTVEKKTGELIANPSISLIDLPGIYSLTPYSADEKVAYDYLTNNKPDLIINIVDSTNLSQSLYLTTQLLELGCDVVVAMNMTDELHDSNLSVNPIELSKIYGCAFFSISAKRNKGVDELIAYCMSGNYLKPKAQHYDKKNLDNDIQLRHTQIKKSIARAVKCTDTLKTKTLTEKIDDIVLNKYLAFPIFAIIMASIFYLALDGIGGLASDWLTQKIFPIILVAVDNILLPIAWLDSLLTDGIMSGIFSVLAFLPQIAVLFCLISILEGSGYMSRIAFIMDKIFSFLGLDGKSCVSMILGCGCATPAILSARTIKDTTQRNSTVALVPLMPCSAKLTLFSFFTANIFDGNGLVALSLYLVSVFAVITGGLILKKHHKSPQNLFILELPKYRMPHIKSVLTETWQRTKAFLVKIGTVIFFASIILWILQNFDFALRMTDCDSSILASIGKAIAPIFAPLGWGKWQFAVATLTGLVAKETVATTLGILYANTSLLSVITPLSAYCFLVFNLLCAPCISAISTSCKETSLIQGMKAIFFQTTLAYAITLVIYQIGIALCNKAFLPLFITIGAICTVALIANELTKLKYSHKKRTE